MIQEGRPNKYSEAQWRDALAIAKANPERTAREIAADVGMPDTIASATRIRQWIYLDRKGECPARFMKKPKK